MKGSNHVLTGMILQAHPTQRPCVLSVLSGAAPQEPYGQKDLIITQLQTPLGDKGCFRK